VHELTAEEILLTVRGAQVPAWLYRPPERAAGPLPALAIGAEATGVNRFIRDAARGLARAGFAVVVPDYYRGEGPADPEDYRDIEEIMRHVGRLDFRRATYDLMAAIDFLQRHPAVDAGRVGVWGYCTGGTLALLTACLRRDVALTVLFYPSQPVFGELSATRPAHPVDLVWNLNCPLFLVYGGQDPVMPPDLLATLRGRLAQWGIDHTIRIFPGCGHSFGAPIPGRHEPVAYQQAWAEAIAFAVDRLGDHGQPVAVAPPRPAWPGAAADPCAQA
jgi:carboxymethylenebutenolidase